jgi:branched-chain amino acid transport system ATP-binding protein
VLNVVALDVSIKTVRILRGVSLSVAAGQMTGLIGRNGAGKTTLLRTLVGALSPRAGAITFDGEPLAGLPSHARARLGIGYMPEDRRIIPQLTVEENLMLPAWAARSAGARERLAKIYRMIPEVEALSGHKGLELSGGQQKLAALGRALMSGTKLLLLDEPFEGVAPVLAQRLAEVIGLLRHQGVTVIVAESDLSYARELLQVVFNIDRGTVTRAPAEPPHSSAPTGGPA